MCVSVRINLARYNYDGLTFAPLIQTNIHSYIPMQSPKCDPLTRIMILERFITPKAFVNLSAEGMRERKEAFLEYLTKTSLHTK